MRVQSDLIGQLNKSIRELSSSDRAVDALALWEALHPTMNDAQFEIAITALRMSADNIKVARMFLVEGLTAHQLNDEYGISPSRLSKVLKRISENYEKQLAAMDLVSGEYALDKKTAKLVRELEASKISEARLKTYVTEKKKKKSRSRK